MLRGLGLLLPALVLGALLHHEVAMSGDCMSLHMSQVMRTHLSSCLVPAAVCPPTEETRVHPAALRCVFQCVWTRFQDL